jgi:flagellar biosynthesis component FlhA
MLLIIGSTLVAFILLPIHGIVIDILLGSGLVFCLAAFISSIFFIKNNHAHLPTIISLALSVSTFFIYISSTRLIIIQGKSIDSMLIKKIGSIITDGVNFAQNIAIAGFFLIYLLLQYYLVSKCFIRNIQEETEKQKLKIVKDVFISTMDSTIKFLNGIMKIGISVFFISVITGSLISFFIQNNRQEALPNIIIPYLVYSITTALFFNISMLFLLFSLNFSVEKNMKLFYTDNI